MLNKISKLFLFIILPPIFVKILIPKIRIIKKQYLAKQEAHQLKGF
jgi:hypothetical protein